MTEVTEGSGNVFADLGVTLTLDDVSKRINTICEQFIDDVKRVKASYETNIDALTAAIEASPDIDQSATISIVLGRVRKMLGDAATVLA